MLTARTLVIGALLTVCVGHAASAAPCVELGLQVPEGGHYQSLEGNRYRARFCAGVLQRVDGRIFGETYRDEERFSYRGGALVGVRARHLRYRSTFGPVAGVSEKRFVVEAGRLVSESPLRKRGFEEPGWPGPAADYLAAGAELGALARAAAAKCLRPDGSRRRDESLRSDCAAPE